jgi:hypothetical protein
VSSKIDRKNDAAKKPKRSYSKIRELIVSTFIASGNLTNARRLEFFGARFASTPSANDCPYGFPAGIKYPMAIALTARHAPASIIASPMVAINVTFSAPSS